MAGGAAGGGAGEAAVAAEAPAPQFKTQANIELKITNVVATLNLNTKLDLKHIATKVPPPTCPCPHHPANPHPSR